MGDDDMIRRRDAQATIRAQKPDLSDGAIQWACDAIDALPAVQVGVKPLEWQTWEHGTSWADSIFGRYSVWDGHWREPNGYGGRASADPEAAAQSDYDARIRSALTVQPAPEVAALRNAGQLLHDMLHMKNGAHSGLTRDQVQALWDSAKDSDGFAAVIEFLTALTALAALEGRADG